VRTNRTTNQDKQMGLPHEGLTGSVIGAAIDVHEALEIKRVIGSERPYQEFLASCLP
jgi:hypothetical protein